MELRDKNGLTEKEYLEQYSPGSYERPSVAADTVIFTVSSSDPDNYRRLPEKKLQLLMIKRAGHPFIGHWALPGGFVEPDESTEQAARRELFEETGVNDIYLEQLYTFSDPGRDPRMWVMSCAYMALADKSSTDLIAGDDADSAGWFDVSLKTISDSTREADGGYIKTEKYRLSLRREELELSAEVLHTRTRSHSGTQDSFCILSSSGIAFDHAKIITAALLRLRGKICYTDIALNLMPEYFTLTELQQVYEIILDQQLFKAPFRRKFGILAEETDRLSQAAGHRPSRLYKRKWLTDQQL